MQKEIKLYNVLFPFWMIMLFPQVWLLVLPGNFLIDSIVLLILMFVLKIEEKKMFYVRNIFKVFGLGLAADIIGSSYMLLLMFVFQIGNMGDELYLTIPALVISGVMIFIFNYFISFRKYDKCIRFKIALTFAIATAPYTFMVPSSWMYG